MTGAYVLYVSQNLELEMARVVAEFPLLSGYLSAIKNHYRDKIEKDRGEYQVLVYKPRGYRRPLERVPVIKKILVFIKIDGPYAYVEGLYFWDRKISVGYDIRHLIKVWRNQCPFSQQEQTTTQVIAAQPPAPDRHQ